MTLLALNVRRAPTLPVPGPSTRNASRAALEEENRAYKELYETLLARHNNPGTVSLATILSYPLSNRAKGTEARPKGRKVTTVRVLTSKKSFDHLQAEARAQEEKEAEKEEAARAREAERVRKEEEALEKGRKEDITKCKEEEQALEDARKKVEKAREDARKTAEKEEERERKRK
ncbi:hypothetical protein BDK51DRAFT_29188 [Blyttiomyces helicus]|uniref:Uncharacterized protein n=1 Tax=Blyttiomyces helicus TaxID=388810 RepID=A0A4P9W562_9FUNG|nr:hypothetical protein BDK51DRAFT_29188 [Blyttiomyces helicus]|eukprot:RKO87082.1 hypothetical protein BDK51DRAFT_29188 [Blyttiomyces helicus]